jgi:hypothetical protein
VLHERKLSIMAKQVIIQSLQPFDISAEEAEELARTIRTLDIDIETQVKAEGRKGRGITWGQVLTISLPFLAWGGNKLADKITDVAIEWARKRYEARLKESKRPTFVNIYGPDGAVVKSVKVNNATDAIEDLTEEKLRLKRK